ncbi:hypothetical protein BXU08_19270 [Sphingomonas sp. LM7]|nr:hypothetical protein BXU08_19270 [Sphingomonas sp. LM7]
MSFQIREEKWQKIYIAPVVEAMRLRTNETTCFHIIGQGFLAPRTPSHMQPWEGSQFVFVKIKRLERLISNVKCAPHPNTNDR